MSGLRGSPEIRDTRCDLLLSACASQLRIHHHRDTRLLRRMWPRGASPSPSVDVSVMAPARSRERLESTRRSGEGRTPLLVRCWSHPMFRCRLHNTVIEPAHPVGQCRPIQSEESDCCSPCLVRRVAQSLRVIQGADQDLLCGVLLHIHSSAPTNSPCSFSVYQTSGSMPFSPTLDARTASRSPR